MGEPETAEYEAKAREQMHEMPQEARGWILHHFGNSLCAVMGALHILHCDLDEKRISLPEWHARLVRNADKAAHHMADDLDVIRGERGA